LRPVQGRSAAPHPGRGGALRFGIGQEIVRVEALPLERHEQVPGLEPPRVGRDAGIGGAARLADGERVGHPAAGPHVSSVPTRRPLRPAPEGAQRAYPGPRSSRPGFAPVCRPSLTTAAPLTNTYRTPTESWCGCSNVARSAIACGSNTTTSAYIPSRKSPRSWIERRVATAEGLFRIA